MTILECLEGLPDNMEFMDLSLSSEAIKTVKQLREENKHDSGDGYYLKTLYFNYGKTEVLSIRCKYGPVFNQKI